MKSGINIVIQVDQLKKRVLLTHPDFQGSYGIIVSVRVSGSFYWILLDNQRITKKGVHTRLRMFNEKYITIIENN